MGGQVTSGDVTTDDFVGLMLFTKKTCGPNFVKEIWNQDKISYKIFDHYHKYTVDSSYVRINKSQTNSVLQFSARDEDGAYELGNLKRDQFYLEISGIANVDMGTIDVDKCL